VEFRETPEAPSLEEEQAGLRRALNDPTLRLLVHDEESGSYLGTTGRSIDVPEESTHEAVTRIAYEGRPIAAVIHDPALRNDPELLHNALAAARLALVKDRSVEWLRASERRNRALLDAIPDNMFRIRGDGTFVDFHSNRPDALALPPERILGSNIRDHLPAEEGASRLEAIRRVIATGRIETIETQRVERSGRLSDREIRMVKSGDNEVLSINRDITDRKRAEREVVLQRDFLTTVVNTATTSPPRSRAARMTSTLADASSGSSSPLPRTPRPCARRSSQTSADVSTSIAGSLRRARAGSSPGRRRPSWTRPVKSAA
jgi:PAS domain S-box-containing protein